MKAVAKRDGGGELAFGPGSFVGASTGSCGAKVIIGAEEFGARFGELGSGVLDVQFEQELTFFYGLAFDGADPFYEGVELRAYDERGDRLYFSIARNGGDDIFTHGRDGGNFCYGLAAAQADEYDGHDGGQDEENQNTVS